MLDSERETVYRTCGKPVIVHDDGEKRLARAFCTTGDDRAAMLNRDGYEIVYMETDSEVGEVKEVK